MFKYVVAALLLVCSSGLANAQSSQSIGLAATVGASCTLGSFNTNSFTITPTAGGTVASGSPMTTTAPVVCNQNVKIQLTSSKVGLANDNTTTAPASGYVNKIHYTATATYNGLSETLNTSQAVASAGGSTASTQGAQVGGSLALAITPITTAPNVLVAGNYSDTLTVTVTPTP